jgi:hypothetical protein
MHDDDEHDPRLRPDMRHHRYRLRSWYRVDAVALWSRRMSRGWFYVCNCEWHSIGGLVQLVAMSPIGANRRTRKGAR